ncbi:ABC transporter ATP-binding protein [Agromyces sp. S2-1-8]|uniref:dipeptide ABC transporter ATP-binding protein n=1 Tax=Agromyces sp. S2-1-8 TaxID=2897180 RepID=UPI001E3AC480|nr:ABC transporter ATP-binding protein [Agromyces sp. S2-1-8]MCD5345402.1 dipeptide ABC transporter ATP-binding protein [Agromyces sp. S2-1-8]
MSLLDISDLTLDLPNGTRLLDGISLGVEAGETVGLVGESGSGKSLTARTVLGLTPDGSALGGRVLVDGRDLVAAGRRDVLDVRRHAAAMIFQDPRAGINPMRTIGDHMTETLRLCEGKSESEARARAIELLTAVRLPRPEDHLKQYPHEFSGGMLQRVMIAGALTSSPKLLVCDEPTTALDVTTQAEIIRVLVEQRASRGMGMLFITHDLNLAASICDRVVVMNKGRVEETGDARRVFSAPQADYTKRLVAATPTVTGSAGPVIEIRDASAPATSPVDAPGGDAAGPVPEPVAAPTPLERPDEASAITVAAAPADDEPILAVAGVSKTYHLRGKPPVHAVASTDLRLARGRALAVVGESGSGKSTLARMIVGLEEPDTGEIRVAGRDRTIVPKSRQERIAHARSVQMVFQDPYLSLDPRITAGRAIEDALRLHTELSTTGARARVVELLEQVGLGAQHAQARPRTLSGGQRQRVAIARALAIEPDVLVMDEATSALDVSVQAQVLDLVARIREERGLTLLFISHDLAVVRRVCEETVVMRYGEIVERGSTVELLAAPQHPYTQLLIDSVPKPEWAPEPRRAEASA